MDRSGEADHPGSTWYPHRAMFFDRRWQLVILAGSLLAYSGSVHSDTPDAGIPSELLVRLGRDLMNRGEMLAAKERFDAAFRSNGNAEALFLSAECWENLGNGDEATLRYRQYLRLPLALRAAEATMRIHALDERKREDSRPGPGKPARYVLVHIATDRGACAEKCTAADVCPRRERKGAFDECLGNQFSCLQSCDGATVGMGACPKLSPQQHLRCFQDRRRTVGPGWLTPGRF